VLRRLVERIQEVLGPLPAQAGPAVGSLAVCCWLPRARRAAWWVVIGYFLGSENHPIAPMKVSILIPVYNEALTLPLVIQRVSAGAASSRVRTRGHRHRRWVDRRNHRRFWPSTAISLSWWCITPSSISVKGTALRIGIAKATADFVLIQDGDLEYNAELDFEKWWSRWLPVRPISSYGFAVSARRKGMNGQLVGQPHPDFLGECVVRARALPDEATGYKAFRTNVLRSIKLNCLRFEFCPEVTAKLRARRLPDPRSGDQLQPSRNSGRKENPLAGRGGGDMDARPLSRPRRCLRSSCSVDSHCGYSFGPTAPAAG